MCVLSGGGSPDVPALTFSWTGRFVLSFISFQVLLCYVTVLPNLFNEWICNIHDMVQDVCAVRRW